jgi:hypothetical protein
MVSGPVDRQHHPEGDDDDEDAGDAADQGFDRGGDQADVGGEARGEPRRRLGLQPCEVGADEPLEHVLLKVRLEPGQQHVGAGDPHVLAAALGEGEPQHEQRPPPDHRELVGLVGLDDELHHLRVARGRHRLDDHEHEHRSDEHPVAHDPFAPETRIALQVEAGAALFRHGFPVDPAVLRAGALAWRQASGQPQRQGPPPPPSTGGKTR